MTINDTDESDRQYSATRQRLLDVAEELFATQGIATVSLRAITSAAGANIAAISYHFGSKKRLIQEVFARRAKVIVEERMRLLEVALEEPDRQRRVTALIAAFLVPGLFGGAESPEAARIVARFRAWLVTESSDFASRIMARYLDETGRRFLEAFGAALPHLTRTDVEWRFHAMISVMVYTMADTKRIHSITGGTCDPDQLREAIVHLLPALTAMFLSPPVTETEAMPEPVSAAAWERHRQRAEVQTAISKSPKGAKKGGKR